MSPGAPRHYQDQEILDHPLGIALAVPRDGRIRLTFDVNLLWMYEKCKSEVRMHLQPSKFLEETRYYTEEIPRLKGRVAAKLEKLHKFDGLMREYGDFCILDMDPGDPDGNVHAVYRAGRPRDQRFIFMIYNHGPPCFPLSIHKLILLSRRPEILVSQGLFYKSNNEKINSSWRRIMCVPEALFIIIR